MRAARAVIAPLCALAFLALAPVCALAADAPQAQPDVSRGELLYNTHCIECHNTKMHWRTNSVVSGWPSLLAQVRKWQQASGQGWREDDVREVARYLNGQYYHLPPP